MFRRSLHVQKLWEERFVRSEKRLPSTKEARSSHTCVGLKAGHPWGPQMGTEFFPKMGDLRHPCWSPFADGLQIQFETPGSMVRSNKYNQNTMHKHMVSYVDVLQDTYLE